MEWFCQGFLKHLDIFGPIAQAVESRAVDSILAQEGWVNGKYDLAVSLLNNR